MSLHKLQYSKIVSRILASERVDRKFGRFVFTKHFCISRRAVDSESLDLFLISPENSGGHPACYCYVKDPGLMPFGKDRPRKVQFTLLR